MLKIKKRKAIAALLSSLFSFSGIPAFARETVTYSGSIDKKTEKQKENPRSRLRNRLNERNKKLEDGKKSEAKLSNTALNFIKNHHSSIVPTIIAVPALFYAGAKGKNLMEQIMINKNTNYKDKQDQKLVELQNEYNKLKAEIETKEGSAVKMIKYSMAADGLAGLKSPFLYDGKGLNFGISGQNISELAPGLAEGVTNAKLELKKNLETDEKLKEEKIKNALKNVPKIIELVGTPTFSERMSNSLAELSAEARLKKNENVSYGILYFFGKFMCAFESAISEALNQNQDKDNNNTLQSLFEPMVDYLFSPAYKERNKDIAAILSLLSYNNRPSEIIKRSFSGNSVIINLISEKLDNIYDQSTSHGSVKPLFARFPALQIKYRSKLRGASPLVSSGIHDAKVAHPKLLKNLDDNNPINKLDFLELADQLLNGTFNSNTIILNVETISNLLENCAMKKDGIPKASFLSFGLIRLITIGLTSNLLKTYLMSFPITQLLSFLWNGNMTQIADLVLADLSNKNGQKIIEHSGTESLFDTISKNVSQSAQSQENYNRDIYQDVTDAAKKIDVIVTEFYANIANPNGYKSYLPPSDWKSLSFEDLNDLADVVQWNCHDYWLSKKKQVTKDLIDKANKLKIKVISDTVKWREKKNNYNENSCWFNNKS